GNDPPLPASRWCVRKMRRGQWCVTYRHPGSAPLQIACSLQFQPKSPGTKSFAPAAQPRVSHNREMGKKFLEGAAIRSVGGLASPSGRSIVGTTSSAGRCKSANAAPGLPATVQPDAVCMEFIAQGETIMIRTLLATTAVATLLASGAFAQEATAPAATPAPATQDAATAAPATLVEGNL